MDTNHSYWSRFVDQRPRGRNQGSVFLGTRLTTYATWLVLFPPQSHVVVGELTENKKNKKKKFCVLICLCVNNIMNLLRINSRCRRYSVMRGWAVVSVLLT